MTVNVALVLPEATASEAGAISAAALLDSPTVAPPAPAALDIVTVHVEVVPVDRLAGLQESPLTIAKVTRDMVADRELPFNVAVTVAV